MSAENTVEEKSRRRRRRSVEEPENELIENDTDEDDVEIVADSSRGVTAKKGRATPGRRNQIAEAEEQRSNALTRPFFDLRDYFIGVQDELRKVSWPTREELRRLTVIVLVVTILASIVLGIISIIFTELFVIGLETPLIFAVVFGAGALAFVAFTRLRGGNRSISPY